MNLLLFAGLFALMIAILKGLESLGAEPGRWPFAALFVFLPILPYSIIDRWLTSTAVARVGRDWCGVRGVEYVEVQQFKGHFAIVYRQNGKAGRQKFSVVFVPTTWRIRSVHWL